MPRFAKRISKKAGMSPGVLIHTGEQKMEKATITVINYDRETLVEKELPSIEEAYQYRDSPPVTWININGLHDVDIIEKVGQQFDIHPLTREDIVNTAQRPKVDDYENYLFVVLKMLSFDDQAGRISSEQISLILGEHYLLSFQEQPGDVFDPVRQRIRGAKGRIRGSGCDYLAYTLIDAVVDHYFTVLEKMVVKIEDLEEELLKKDPAPQMLETIHYLKREMIYFRKQVWPLREVINAHVKDQSQLIQETTRVFLRDVYDHTIQVIDTIESLRDVLSGLQDLYLSTISNRMNEVMKVLTIMATIFIPLTFIAGIYGMNFEYMPELKWKWSYPLLWVLLLAIFGLMLFWFKRKKWL
jgi:magnesium transporter